MIVTLNGNTNNCIFYGGGQNQGKIDCRLGLCSETI